MDAALLESIPFYYSIVLWKGDVPLMDIWGKGLISAKPRTNPCILKAGNAEIAIGHIEQGRFVIDELLIAGNDRPGPIPDPRTSDERRGI